MYCNKRTRRGFGPERKTERVSVAITSRLEGDRERPSLARLHSSSYFTLYALRQSTCPRPTCQSGGGGGSESGGEGRGTHPAHLCLDRERNRNSNSEHSRRGGYSPHASRHWVGSYAPLNEDI